MASCLLMNLCLLTLLFSCVTAEELNETVTCTFTNGKDCSHLLDMNNTLEYTIEKEEINRTGVKIIFDTERSVDFIHVTSGEKPETRVQMINITRGLLNHLVNLSCSKENHVAKIKLEPVLITKEIQIDFVKGCGSETDPITIKNIHYTFGTDEGDLFQNASESEKSFQKQEAPPTGAYLPTALSHTDLLTTLTVPKAPLTEAAAAGLDLEVSTVKPTSRLPTKRTRPATQFTKTKLVITGKPMTVTKKGKVEEKPDSKIGLKVGESKSSAARVGRDLASLCLALFLFYHV